MKQALYQAGVTELVLEGVHVHDIMITALRAAVVKVELCTSPNIPFEAVLYLQRTLW